MGFTLVSVKHRRDSSGKCMGDMRIVLGDSFGVVEQALGVSSEDGFNNVIVKLQEMKEWLDGAGILVDFDALLYLLGHLEVVEGHGLCGNRGFAEDYTEFIQQVQRDTGTKVNSVQEAWAALMRGLCDNITELYRYGLEGSREEGYLLKLLQFLAYTEAIETVIDCSI